MKVTQEEIAQRQAVLQIELEPEDVERYLDRAYNRLVQRTTIPGFRKGKAPRRVLESFLGREALLSEAMEFLVPESTSQAVQEQHLDAVANPTVDVVQMEPTILKATVPLTPTVNLGSYRELRLEEDPVEVTEEQAQQVMATLRRNQAPWEPADRPVQHEDLVTMHVRGEADGQVLADQKSVTYLVEEKSEIPFTGFAEHLLGIEPQQTKEFTATLPDAYEDPQVPGMAGKEARFTVTILEVKERRFPELDDEFAKGVGEGYEGLAALKERIEQDLTDEAERAAQKRLEERVVEEVIQASTVELPPLLIDHEIDHLLEDQQRSLSRGGSSKEAYLQTAGKSLEELREELRERATSRLTSAWVVAQVAEEEGLGVTPEELDEEVARMAEGAGQQGEAIRQTFADPGLMETLSQVVLARKATQRLAQIARGEGDQNSPGAAPEGAEPEDMVQDADDTETAIGGTADGD